MKRTLRPSTFDDYKTILEHTPELQVLERKPVATFTDVTAAEIYAKIHEHTEPHSEHVARVISSMWTFLARPGNRGRTSVQRYAIRNAKPPAQTRHEIGDDGYEGKDNAPPSTLEIGRAIAIAKSGALNVPQSAAIKIVAVSANAVGRWYPFMRPTLGRMPAESLILCALLLRAPA